MHLGTSTVVVSVVPHGQIARQNLLLRYINCSILHKIQYICLQYNGYSVT